MSCGARSAGSPAFDSLSPPLGHGSDPRPVSPRETPREATLAARRQRYYWPISSTNGAMSSSTPPRGPLSVKLTVGNGSRAPGRSAAATRCKASTVGHARTRPDCRWSQFEPKRTAGLLKGSRKSTDEIDGRLPRAPKPTRTTGNVDSELPSLRMPSQFVDFATTTARQHSVFAVGLTRRTALLCPLVRNEALSTIW